MKTKIKKIVLPMVVALIAIAGAFASNLSSKDSTALVDRIGYVRSGVTCTPSAKTCTTDMNPFICTNAEGILYDWNGTACPLHLYEKL